MAHAALAARRRSPDARARHLGRAADGTGRGGRRWPSREPAAGRADRGATLDAAALYLEAARLTPDDPAGSRLRRAMARGGVPVRRPLRDRPGGRDPRRCPSGCSRPRARLRAEALSLRALIRYYHGRVPDAIELGRAGARRGGGRADPPREGPRARRVRRRCSTTSSAASRWSTRPSACSREQPGPVDPDLARQRPPPARRRRARARPPDPTGPRSSGACGS